MLSTFDYYQAVTGDTVTPEAAWATAASSAQELLEGDLRRPVESAERTEQCDVWPNGDMYPLATPITDVDGLTFYDDTVYGGTPDLPTWIGLIGSETPPRATITYTGGYSNSTAPEYLLRDLAFVAWAILHPLPALASTAGASSVSVGDVSVSYGPGGSQGASVTGVQWSAATMRHRWTEA